MSYEEMKADRDRCYESFTQASNRLKGLEFQYKELRKKIQQGALFEQQDETNPNEILTCPDCGSDMLTLDCIELALCPKCPKTLLHFSECGRKSDKTCPECGAILYSHDEEDGDILWYCPTKDCPYSTMPYEITAGDVEEEGESVASDRERIKEEILERSKKEAKEWALSQDKHRRRME